MINSKNISQHELIGLKTEISDSTNPQIIGINGTIINETKSMFTLNTINGKKIFPKAHCIWNFILNKQQIMINGSKIEKRPFDRMRGKIWPKI